jgi:hypothetical protein
MLRRPPGVCLSTLRHCGSSSLSPCLAEFLLPGELLPLGLCRRYVGLQHGNLRLQDFALAFTLAPLLRESVLLLQLLGLFMGLLSQPGRASEHSGRPNIDVL